MTTFLLRHLLVLVSVILIGGVAVVATDEAGTAYLEEKSKLPHVVTLPSGLRYKVLEKGQGGFHPKVGHALSLSLCRYPNGWYWI